MYERQPTGQHGIRDVVTEKDKVRGRRPFRISPPLVRITWCANLDRDTFAGSATRPHLRVDRQCDRKIVAQQVHRSTLCEPLGDQVAPESRVCDEESRRHRESADRRAASITVHLQNLDHPWSPTRRASGARSMRRSDAQHRPAIDTRNFECRSSTGHRDRGICRQSGTIALARCRRRARGQAPRRLRSQAAMSRCASSSPVTSARWRLPPGRVHLIIAIHLAAIRSIQVGMDVEDHARPQTCNAPDESAIELATAIPRKQREDNPELHVTHSRNVEVRPQPATSSPSSGAMSILRRRFREKKPVRQEVQRFACNHPFPIGATDQPRACVPMVR